MNEIYFTHSGYVILEMKIPSGRISAEGNNIFPLIKIPTQLYSKQNKKVQKLIGISLNGKLLLENQLLSIMKPVAHNLDLWNNFSDSPLEIHFPITLKEIEYIELIRKEEINFKVKFDFQYMYFEEQNKFPYCNVATAESFFIIPQSDWVKNVLPNIGFNKQVLIEIPIPEIEENITTKQAIAALEQAQKHFYNGAFDDVVGRCRLALEPFFDKKEIDNKPRKFLKEKWKNDLGKSTYNWLNEVMLAANEPTNKPHHSPNKHFDRNEAQVILMITTGLVSFIAREGIKEEK